MFGRLFLSAVLAVLSGCVFSLQTVAQPYERPPFAHEVSDIKSDERVVYGQLANGLRYAVMENKTPSGVGSMQLRFAVGSLNETEDILGLAHFLEHMAFNGSKNVPEGEMTKRLERHGLAFGADTNAHTGFEETVYKLNLPNVGDEVMDEAFMLMRETASSLTLDQGAIDRERGIIFSEKRTRDTRHYRQYVARLKFFTLGSGLGDRFPIGVDETIGGVNDAQFRAFYDAHYHPEKAFFVFVGDVPVAEVIARIEATFGDWTGAGRPGPNPSRLPSVSHRPGAVGYYFDPEIMESVSFAVLHPFEDRPDTQENRRKRLVESFVVQMLNQRLSKLRYDPDSGVLTSRASRGSLYDLARISAIMVTSTPEDWAKAMASSEQALRRAVQFGFDPVEFDRVVRRMRDDYESAIEADKTNRTPGLVNAIMSAYRNETVLENPEDGLARFDRDVATLTLEEANQVLRDMWAGIENPMIYLVSPTEIADPGQTAQEAFQLSRMAPVLSGEALNDNGFAYTNFGPDGQIVERTWLEDVDAHTVRFANNVLLTVKQTDFADDDVRFFARIGDGALSLPRKDEGLRRLGLNLLSRGGLEKHTESDLNDIVPDWQVFYRTGLYKASDAIHFEGASTRSDFPNLLNVLTARIVAPGLRREAGERYKRQIAAWYPTHDATPQGVADKYVPRIIRSGDPRFGFPELEAFLAADHDEAAGWIGGQLADGMIEITVVGDIAVEDAVAEVARTFGALPPRKAARGIYPEATTLRFPAREQDIVTLTHAGEANKVLVQIYWPAPDGTDPARSWAMRVLSKVFGNRLLEEIREKEAAVYGTGAGYYGKPLFPGYGYVVASMELQPEDVSRIMTRVEDIAAELYDGVISDDEFRRVMTPIEEDIPAWLQSNGYWLSTLVDVQSSRFGLARHEAALALQTVLTVDDLRLLARDVFAPGQSIRIKVVPRITEDDT